MRRTSIRWWSAAKRLAGRSGAPWDLSRAGVNPACSGRVEVLETRTLLSASFQLVADPTSAGSPGHGRASILVPALGGHANVRAESGEVVSSPATAEQTAQLNGAFNINIVAGSGLASNAAALAAFERAAAQWESRITDPIQVNINAELSDLGSTSVIGQTSSVQLEDAFGVVCNAMVSDAADEPDDAVVASLPTSGSFVMPSRITYSGKLAGTKASLKALGFTGLDAQFGAKDGDITFNSRFAFDFDNSNGVGGSQMDFETVAAHEIGHALGFVSMVDTVDYYARYRLRGAVPASTLDLFRFENNVAGRDPATAGDFAGFARSLRPNVDAVTDDLTGWNAAAAENRMSTGYYTGDGRQASHWKDGDLTGTVIGNLDPTLAFGQKVPISDADWRALDLIGWDIGDVSGPANQLPVAGDDTGATSEDEVLAVAAPGLLVNDTDPDGDAVAAVATSGTSALGAAFTVNPDGSYTYDPRLSNTLQAMAATQSANDTFSYTVSDGRGGTDTATVTITVSGADEAPGSIPPGDGLLVSYFSSSNFTNQKGAEALDPDGVVNEDWGVLSPASGVSSDNFTVRWRGQVMAPASGDYTFYAKVDDNVRLWVNDQLVIRRWGTANTSEWKTATPIALAAGETYNIQMDFRELSGGASAALRWAAPGVVAKQVIPKASLYSTPAPTVKTDPYLTNKSRKDDNTIVGLDNGNGSTTVTTPPGNPMARNRGPFSSALIAAGGASTSGASEDEVEALLG